MSHHILYIHQFFKTPEEGGITRSYDIAKELLNHNFKITLITSWNESHLERKKIEGINVVYLPIPYKNEFDFKKRILSFYQFAVKAIRIGKQIESPDLIYATSTPLTIGWVGKKLSKYFKVPWIFEVRDLWPEAPIQIGVVKNTFLKFIFYRLEKHFYRSSDGLVALSPTIQKYIEGKSKRIATLIPNLSNNDRFHYFQSKITEKFVVGYFGAISQANGLERLVEVAEFLEKRNYGQIEFRVFGEGQCLNNLIAKVKHLKNIHFYGKLSKVKLIEQVNLCHASYISFLKLPVLESCSPNKFFDSLAAGKLIIVNNEGWLKDLIEKKECGFYAPNPEEFIERLYPFLKSEKKLKKAQQNAKKLAIDEFDRKQLILKLNELILACILPA